MSHKLRTQHFKTLINIVTILALVGITYALRDKLAETFDNFHRVNLYVLLLVLPLQATNYFAQGKLYQNMFRLLGVRFRTRPMIRLASEMTLVNNVFPSGGVSGFSYIALRLRTEGVSTSQATLVQVMKFILIFMGFQIMLFFGLIALAIGGRANDFTMLVAGMLATLVLVGTFLLVYVIGSKSRINAFFTALTMFLNKLIHVFRRSHPETINIQRAKNAFTELHENYMLLRNNLRGLRQPLGFALLANASEVLTIYVVYLAFGSVVNIGAVILAYAVANFAGLVSVLPGGIGIYEALMTGVLAAGGVPPALSLPVTVMYRVLNMLIQLPIGYYFYHQALRDAPRSERAVT